MKYYKLFEDVEQYGALENGKIYPEDHISKYKSIAVKELVEIYPSDWKEVAKQEYQRQEFESDNTMNKQQRIERLEKELDDQFKLLNELKKEVEQEQFKEDVWYNLDNSKAIVKYVGNNKGVGITGLGDWGESIAMNFPEEWREATKEEIKQALDKERKRRGLIEGKTIATPKNAYEYFLGSDQLEYDKKHDILTLDGKYIYCEGEWAEPIQKNKVGEYDVKENNNGRIDIGCEINIKPSHLSWLKGICQRNNVMVYLEGTDVTNDIINLKL